MINFEPDGFGAHAKASYCADYLELLAWTQKAPRWGDYDEYLRAAAVRVAESYVGGDLARELAGDDFDSDAADFGGDAAGVSKIFYVKNVIEERVELLGDEYPFEAHDDRLVFKRENDNYLGLLSLCHLHVSKDSGGDSPARIFERTVSDSFRSAGFAAAVMGTSSSSTFEEALLGVCSDLDLTGNPNGIAYSRWRKDDGADCIVKVPFGERRRRPGQWIFVGQATIAGSHRWLEKSRETSASAWRSYLCLHQDPGRFLAVPHHVQRDAWQYLTDRFDNGLVIDRLRICSMVRSTNPDLAAAAARLVRVGVKELD